MRKRCCVLVVCAVAMGPAIAEPAAGGEVAPAANPFEAVARDTFSGRYVSSDGRMRVNKEGDHYTGLVSFKGNAYPFTARDFDGRLVGSFGEGATTYPFEAKATGDGIVFTAADFKMELTRCVLPPLKGVFESENVRVVFQEPSSGKSRGTLILKGKEYAFEADDVNGELKGSFKTDAQDFPFALFNDSGDLCFQSGSFSEVVLSSQQKYNLAIASLFKQVSKEFSALGITKRRRNYKYTNLTVIYDEQEECFIDIETGKVSIKIEDTKTIYEDHGRNKEVEPNRHFEITFPLTEVSKVELVKDDDSPNSKIIFTAATRGLNWSGEGPKKTYDHHLGEYDREDKFFSIFEHAIDEINNLKKKYLISP